MVSGVWRQVFASFTASMSTMAVGVAYGWSSPVLPQLLKPGSIIPMTPDEASWVVVCLELGCLFSAIPAGLVVDRFGRKRTLLLSSPLLVLSWLIVLFTRSVPWLYICKLLQGSYLGIIFCIIPIYSTEVSQPSIRGILSTTLVTMWYIGFIISYTIGSYLSYDNIAYISLAISAINVIPFAFQPESPYYYFLINQKENGIKSLSYLRNAHPSQLTEELKAIEEYVRDEKENRASLVSLFRDSISLRCLCIMLVIAGTNIYTGLTTVYAYATHIFSTTSSANVSPEQYSIIISIIFLVTNLITAALIDKVGRRGLALASCVGCFFSTMTASIFFYINSKTNIDVSYLHWVPLAVIGCYCISVSIGVNPLCTSFQGEIFPVNTRSVASGFISCSIAIFSSSCLKLYYLVDLNIGLYFNYLLFSLCACVGGVLLYLYMPETKGKTFAQIQRELNHRYVKVATSDKDMEPMK